MFQGLSNYPFWGNADVWQFWGICPSKCIVWVGKLINTLPETNIAPENGWLEDYFPIGEAYFQGLR